MVQLEDLPYEILRRIIFYVIQTHRHEVRNVLNIANSSSFLDGVVRLVVWEELNKRRTLRNRIPWQYMHKRLEHIMVLLLSYVR